MSAGVALLGGVAFALQVSASALCAQVPLQAVGKPMEYKFNPEVMHFSPDGSRLMTPAGVVWLWDVATQRIVGEGIMGPDRFTGADRPKGARLDGDKFCGVVTSAFTPDGKALIVVSDGFLQRWDPVKGRPLARGIPVAATGRPATQKRESLQGPAAFRPDRKLVLVQYRSSQALPMPGKLAFNSAYQGLILSTATGKVVGAPLRYEQHVKVKNRSQLEVKACTFTEDGKRVITLHDNGEVRVWDAAAGKPIKPVLQLPERGTRHLAPDGKTLATVGYARLDLWDLATGKLLGTAKLGGSETDVRLAFRADGQMLAVFGPDAGGHEEVRVLAVPSLKVQATFRQDRIRNLLFSPDGKTLLTMTGESPMKLWDTTTGKQLAFVKGQGAYQTAAFSPDGTLLATAFGTAMYAGPSSSRVQLWQLPAAAPK
jgi:WD40 repeat protein